MVKTIICVLDFKCESESVLEWAVEMGRQNKASLIILFSYRLTSSHGSEDAQLLRAKIEADARARFLEIENKLLTNTLTTYTFLVEVGFISDRILSHVQRNEDCMLILGNEVAQLIHRNDEKGFIFYLQELKIPTVILPDAHSEVKATK